MKSNKKKDIYLLKIKENPELKRSERVIISNRNNRNLLFLHPVKLILRHFLTKSNKHRRTKSIELTK